MQQNTMIVGILLCLTAITAVEAVDADVLEVEDQLKSQVSEFVENAKEHENIRIREETGEKKVFAHVMHNYEPAIRPVKNWSSTVEVKLGLALIKIVELDLSKKFITVNVWLGQEWKDEFIVWDPKQFDGVKSLRIPSKHVWRPDISLYNSFSNFKEINREQYRVVAHYDGTMSWMPALTLSANCQIDFKYFPFDEQHCNLVFGSWVHHGFHVDITNRTAQIHLHEYYSNAEYEVVETKQMRRLIKYACCKEPYPNMNFIIIIRRRPQYYLINLILPCSVLSWLSVLIFCLPIDNNGARVTLGAGVFLSFWVILLPIRAKMPLSSQSVSLLEKYVTFIMGLISLPLVLSVWVEKFRISCSRVPGILLKFLPNWSLAGGNNTIHNDQSFPLLPTLSSSNHEQVTNMHENQESLNAAISSMEQRLSINITDNNNESKQNASYWKAIARFFDRVFFWLILTLNIISTLSMLVIYQNQFAQKS